MLIIGLMAPVVGGVSIRSEDTDSEDKKSYVFCCRVLTPPGSQRIMIDDARERQYRKYIKHRDGYECRVCGRGTDLHVHHRIKKGAAKGRDYRYIDVNGLTLCSMCHHMLHNDTEWKKDFDTKYPDEWVLFKIESGEFIEIK